MLAGSSKTPQIATTTNAVCNTRSYALECLIFGITLTVVQQRKMMAIARFFVKGLYEYNFIGPRGGESGETAESRPITRLQNQADSLVVLMSGPVYALCMHTTPYAYAQG